MKPLDIEKIIIGIGLLWILSTTILFLGGWVTPVLAYTLSTGLLIYSYKSWKQITTKLQQDKKHIIHLSILAILAFLCSVYSGITGYFPQHILDMAQRNAVYGNLCQADWPVVLPDGRYFVYYYAAFLPPAFISKIIGYEHAPAILMLWNTLALFLAFSLIYFRTRSARIAWAGILIVCFLYDPVILLKPLTPYIKEYLGIQTNMNAQACCILTAIQTTINHAPGILLITTILFNKRVHHSTLPILGATSIPISVFGAISILPFLAYRYLKLNERETTYQTLSHSIKVFTTSGAGICSALVAAITLLYHKCADGDIVVCPIFFVTYGLPIWYIVTKNIIHTGIIVAYLMLPQLWLQKQHAGFFWVLFFSLIITNFLFIGNGGPNELAFKGNTALFVIAGFGWMYTLQRGPTLYKALVLIFTATLVIPYSYTSITPRIKQFEKNSLYVNNPFNGHLYHPGSLLDQSVPQSIPPLIPHILYTKAGESRQILPFSLLPQEKEELYSVPATYRPDNKFLQKTPNNKNLKILFHDKD